jgi:hypothetical protein
MTSYLFTLDNTAIPGVLKELPDDAAAKRHACIIADGINRRVLVVDQDGDLLAAVSPIDE